MVGVAYTPPVLRNSTPSSRVFQATEYLASPVITTATVLGNLFYDVYVNPAAWNTTRAYEEALLWGYYRFKRLIFHFEASAPTAYGGQIAVGTDTSVDSLPGVGASGDIGYILALPGSRTASIWQNFNIPFDCRKGFRPFEWFQTAITGENAPSSVTGSQGRLLCALTQPINNATGGTNVTWTIRVEYVIEFARPQLTIPINTFAPIIIPTGTAVSLNVSGQGSVGSWAGFSTLLQNQVWFLTPSITDWMTVNSPEGNYLAVTQGGTITFFSNYPSTFDRGDCVGFGSGVGLTKPTTMYFVGYV